MSKSKTNEVDINKIYEDISNLYEYNCDDNSAVDKIIDKIPSLIENGLATTFSQSEYVGFAGAAYYRIGSKFIQKYNKSYKNNVRDLKRFEFGEEETVSSKNNKELVKLTKYVLENGKYTAQVDKGTYAIFVIVTNDQQAMVSSNMHFIGKKVKKWKRKYTDILEKYKEYSYTQKSEVISFSNGDRNITTTFKPFNQLIIKDKKNIIKYIDNWYKSIPIYYNKYNTIPKLSILLYGPPGTGKSSFYKALARYLNIYDIMIMNQGYFYGETRKLERYTDYGYGIRPMIYSIDDIDCICSSREKKNDRYNSEALSNLLAFLDNPPTFDMKAEDGVKYPVSIVVATTNYYDKLDEAVKRYGRFDLAIEMNNFDAKLAQKMCDIYELNLKDIVKGSNKSNFSISPAKLQAICQRNIDKMLKNVNHEVEKENGKIIIHRK